MILEEGLRVNLFLAAETSFFRGCAMAILLRTVIATLAFLVACDARSDGLPQLMLDTGGHLGIVRSAAFLTSKSRLVSAGDDKVIRVWDLGLKGTEFVLRGQAGPGKEGNIAALAVSPDDRWLAAGGWSSADDALEPCCGDIRLYDLSERKQVAVLRGHTDALTSLAFSPDGRYLLSGSADKTAILWDATTRKALKTLSHHAGAVSKVAFAKGGAVAVSGGADGVILISNVADGFAQGEFRLSAAVTAFALDPVGNWLAAGLANGEVRIIDISTSGTSVMLAKLENSVRTLAIYNDAGAVLASCNCIDTSIRAISIKTGASRAIYAGHDNIVTALAIAPDGVQAASAGGERHEIHVWSLDNGERVAALAGLGKAVWQAGFGKDGREIAWGDSDPCPELLSCPNKPSPLTFKLKLPTEGGLLGEPEAVQSQDGFLRATTLVPGAELAAVETRSPKRRDGTLEIREKGKVRAIIERDATNGLVHSAFTFLANGTKIVSGGAGGSLILYDRDGRSAGSFTGHTDQILSVTASADGALLLSASLDQTVRLWNVAERKLIVTLFRGSDGTWIAWTPEGYYTGSPGADRIVGWQMNKGADQSPYYVGADQLGQHLHRPDIVERALILGSSERAVEEAEGTRVKLGELLRRKIPDFLIVDPAQGAKAPEEAQITVAIQANSDPIKLINVAVNGTQIQRAVPATGSGGGASGEVKLDVPLYSGRNDVRVSLVNDVGERSETLTLHREGPGWLDERGTLYIVAIGVDMYSGLGNRCGPKGTSSCDLRYAGIDARTIAASIEKRLSAKHNATVKRVLSGATPSEMPTAANILDALDLLKKARENDTVVVFIAGHGLNDRGSYRFLASDSEWAGKSLRSSSVVSWFAIQEALETAKGRRILIADTCHAGNSYNPRLGNAAYHANIIAYTATRFDQLSLEDKKVGHGLFTFAFLEALNDKAATERLSTKDMADYLARRVSELAKERGASQDPQYFRGRDAEDYILAAP